MTPVNSTGRILALLLVLGVAASCSRIKTPNITPEPSPTPSQKMEVPKAMAPEDSTPAKVQEATLGAGCFWCVEAVYQELKGVISVESGYSGGHVENPTYEQICSKTTGHAEVCRITYDPSKTSFSDLLQVFWKTHDPTTPNRQGNDEGPQYRSVVYYHDDAQKDLATSIKADLDSSGAWPDPIVTEIEPLTNYYKAEAYHQDYFTNNPNDRYCAYVIQPKMEKFRKAFKNKLKK